MLKKIYDFFYSPKYFAKIWQNFLKKKIIIILSKEIWKNDKNEKNRFIPEFDQP